MLTKQHLIIAGLLFGFIGGIFLIVHQANQPVCINRGADLPIYLANYPAMDEAAGYSLKNLGALTIWRDNHPVAIYLPAHATPEELVRLTIHELVKHASHDDPKAVPPEMQKLLDRVSTDGWDVRPCAVPR